MVYYLRVADELEELANLVHARSPNTSMLEKRLELFAHEIRQDVRLTGWLELD